MVPAEIVHVTIVPPDTLDAPLVQRVSEIVGKDPYGTRLLLVGKIPRIIAHYTTMDAANMTAERLESLGLTVMLVRESDIRRPVRAFEANAMTVEEQHIHFHDKNGEERKISPQDIFLIIKGVTRTRLEKETITNSRKLNISATVLTGGIPIRRKVKETTKDTQIKNEGFIRLYDRTSIEQCVEILQSDFNYACLGTALALSSLANFNAAAAMIRETFPQAIWDERLTDFYQADIPTSSAEESTEINCKLISMYYSSQQLD